MEQDAIVGYGSERDTKINYGLCEVFIPVSRKIGSKRSPFWRWLHNFNPDEVEVNPVISLNYELFWEKLRLDLVKSKVQARPTIFIHGYGNKFEDAVLQAAEIGHDLDIGGGIALFSWPSQGAFLNPLNYTADLSAADRSKRLLADFITEYVENVNDREINVLAHSMGCRCLMGAIEVLSNGREEILKKIRQVIVAAADVDSADMPDQATHAIGRTKGITSYSCDADKALKLSRTVHSSERVGLNPPVFTMNGIDTVVVSKSASLGLLSHQYHATSLPVLNDMFNVLLHELPPDKRFSLIPVTEGTQTYWRMKE